MEWIREFTGKLSKEKDEDNDNPIKQVGKSTKSKEKVNGGTKRLN